MIITGSGLKANPYKEYSLLSAGGSFGLYEADFQIRTSLSFISSNKRNFTNNYLINSVPKSYYDDVFVKDEQTLKYKPGVHLQSDLNGDIVSVDMIRLPSLNSISENELFIKSPLTEIIKMKLKLIYTKID